MYRTVQILKQSSSPYAMAGFSNRGAKEISLPTTRLMYGCSQYFILFHFLHGRMFSRDSSFWKCHKSFFFIFFVIQDICLIVHITNYPSISYAVNLFCSYSCSVSYHYNYHTALLWNVLWALSANNFYNAYFNMHYTACFIMFIS